MKQMTFLFAALLIFLLSACSSPETSSGAADNAGSLPSESVVALDEGVWPVNEYTEGLPVPPGTVAWALLDTEHQNCSVSMTDISENEYRDYMNLLEQEGFAVVEESSEEIAGQDFVSVGTLLSGEEKSLSVSYLPDTFTIYIVFND